MKKSFLSLLAASALLASCDNLSKPQTKDEPQEATRDTAVVYRNGQTAADVATGAANSVENAADKAGNAISDAWDMTKAKLADVKLPEINLPDVTVRGNDDYQVYSIDEKILFDTNKATLKSSAAAAVNQVVASVKKRYADKDVRVLGFADSRGDASYNYELAEKRAEAVKNYLVSTGKMDAGKVSVESFGEHKPVASNATAAGRQENRRVEIAVHVR